MLADRRSNATGTPIRDDALVVQGAEVGASGDVARTQFEAQSKGLNDTATDLKLQRVVAEEGEVARAAARRDTGKHGDHPALGGIFGQAVEVWGNGGFERREIALAADGDIADAVENDQGQFGIGLEGEF